jgi:hypothetical protein
MVDFEINYKSETVSISELDEHVRRVAENNLINGIQEYK